MMLYKICLQEHGETMQMKMGPSPRTFRKMMEMFSGLTSI